MSINFRLSTQMFRLNEIDRNNFERIRIKVFYEIVSCEGFGWALFFIFFNGFGICVSISKRALIVTECTLSYEFAINHLSIWRNMLSTHVSIFHVNCSVGTIR